MTDGKVTTYDPADPETAARLKAQRKAEEQAKKSSQ